MYDNPVKKHILSLLFMLCSCIAFSQKLLTSWSQQNIQNYTKEMYDDAQTLRPFQLLSKNINDKYWSEVFLTLNASINNYSKDTGYLKGLTVQITNTSETKLQGTSRLIIWDRIITGDIVFEGKGLVFDNDLFTIGGRANQILQSLTKKNFGYITMHSTDQEREQLMRKWIDHLANETVEEYKPEEKPKAKIQEITSLTAIHALIVSLQKNDTKDQITKTCLKTIYKLDEMPKERGSSASYCDPDTYTFSYLGLLFGFKYDESKDAKWWKEFWNTNKDKLVWNQEQGIYEVAK